MDKPSTDKVYFGKQNTKMTIMLNKKKNNMQISIL